jgi:hypothetical protein
MNPQNIEQTNIHVQQQSQANATVIHQHQQLLNVQQQLFQALNTQPSVSETVVNNAVQHAQNMQQQLQQVTIEAQQALNQIQGRAQEAAIAQEHELKAQAEQAYADRMREMQAEVERARQDMFLQMRQEMMTKLEEERARLDFENQRRRLEQVNLMQQERAEFMTKAGKAVEEEKLAQLHARAQEQILRQRVQQ